MAAVIRLKRRVDEDPLNAFVLNCKRQRTELGGEAPIAGDTGSGSSNETAMVLKFAGTFEKVCDSSFFVIFFLVIVYICRLTISHHTCASA